jgi:hemoglobin
VSDEEQTVYDVVGGQPFFDALVERFYARVDASPDLRPLYPDDLEPGKRSLALFLGQYWGGPTTYSDEKGHPRLRMRHAPFVIDQRARDAWFAAMVASVRDVDLDSDTEQRFVDYFTMAADAMINAPG